MKSAEEIMEILEGFDLTESYRDAAELAGCSPNTVARYVAARAAGMLVPDRAAPRPSVIDGFLPKLEELVERSQGKIRAGCPSPKRKAGCRKTPTVQLLAKKYFKLTVPPVVNK